MDDLKLEFWGDMQKTFFVENTALAMLSNSQLEGLISTDGRKAHRPIISMPHVGTYTPYQDITFNRKTAAKQTLEVDTFSYAAEEIDVTDKNQTRYPLTEGAAATQMKVHNNKIEQAVMSKITGAFSVIEGAGATTLTIDTTNAFDIFEQGDTTLGGVDAPFEDRIAVFGPHTISTMRRVKMQRETALGDTVMANGSIGPFLGYTIIQSNNLPYSATLTMDTIATALDTVTITGVVFQFVTALVDVTSVNYIAVLVGANVAASRLNLKHAIENDTASKGTGWAEATGSVALVNRFTLNEKRSITIGNAQDMLLVGFGDIVLSETFTAATNVFSAQEQLAIIGNKGMIDFVLQIQEIDTTKKEKGFADLIKSLVGYGVKMFDDGARVAVKVRINASAWK